MEKIKDAADFDEKIKGSEFVIIDFSSPGCAPCKKVPPLLEEVLAQLADKDITAFEVDITENIEVARKTFVMGVPTIIIYKAGKELKRLSSVPKKDKLIKFIK